MRRLICVLRILMQRSVKKEPEVGKDQKSK